MFRPPPHKLYFLLKADFLKHFSTAQGTMTAYGHSSSDALAQLVMDPLWSQGSPSCSKGER